MIWGELGQPRLSSVFITGAQRMLKAASKSPDSGVFLREQAESSKRNQTTIEDGLQGIGASRYHAIEAVGRSHSAESLYSKLYFNPQIRCLPLSRFLDILSLCPGSAPQLP